MISNALHQHSSGGHLFVCYSHHDISLIEREAEWLRQQGFKLWYDSHIAAGHAWSEELAEAITNATAVLYFVSSHSSTSSYCMDELHFAKDQRIPVIPIEVEEVKLSPGLQLTLGTKQFVRMYDTNRSTFRSKLAAGLTALQANGQKNAAVPATFVAETVMIKPRTLKARIAGVAAAITTLFVIFFLSLGD